MQCAWRLAWYKLYYPLEFYKVMIDARYNEVDFHKIIADMEEIAINFKKSNSETEDSYDNLVEYYNLYQNKERYQGYQFFLKYYSEGYKLVSKEVSDLELCSCEIDRKNNVIIVPVRN